MPKKVLIVEDYEDTRDFMKFLLEMSGYQVLEAADGQEAIDNVKKQCPDLVLMDISLPLMDGLTATRIIRKFEKSFELPIIAVTAHGKSFYKQAIEAGCNELISKPIDFDSLQPVIEQYLSK